MIGNRTVLHLRGAKLAWHGMSVIRIGHADREDRLQPGSP
jgi:hypothetical protein